MEDVMDEGNDPATPLLRDEPRGYRHGDGDGPGEEGIASHTREGAGGDADCEPSPPAAAMSSSGVETAAASDGPENFERPSSARKGHHFWRPTGKMTIHPLSRGHEKQAKERNETPFLDGKGTRCARSAKTRRVWLFGLEMNRNQAARIVDIGKWSNWAWWFYLTPRCASSVFNRPGLHATVWVYLIIGNIAYFTTYKKYAGVEGIVNMHLPLYDSQIVKMQENWARILITFSLTTFVSKVVDTYWKGTRTKVSALVRTVNKVVDTILVSVDYGSPRSQPFLESLHKMLMAAVEYSLCQATKGTKYKLSKEETADIFKSRGLDPDYLLSLPVKQTITVLRVATLQSLREERDHPNGCLKGLEAPSWDSLRSDVADFAGAAMSVTTSCKSSKLPYAYVAIVQWGVRVMTFCFTVFCFLGGALGDLEGSIPMPFTCWERKWPYCHTKPYLWANISFLFCLYFIFGLLDVYHAVGQMIWQDGLVKASYLKTINGVCQFLLDRPRTFAELGVSKGEDETAAKDAGTVEKETADETLAARQQIAKSGNCMNSQGDEIPDTADHMLA
ncbi:hypothetical protein ACHAWF_018059 [Thalassiosira exigua]